MHQNPLTIHHLKPYLNANYRLIYMFMGRGLKLKTIARGRKILVDDLLGFRNVEKGGKVDIKQVYKEGKLVTFKLNVS